MSSTENPSTSSSDTGDPTLQPSHTEIDFNELVLLNAIGRGTYGLVQKAIWRGTEVAVKVINTEMEKRALLVELKQLQRVRHDNIVKLHGACTRGRTCLVMEYMEGGSLHDFLHGNPKIPYTSGHAVSWATQCANAIAYLHGLRLVHRDLKPPNLLLTDHWRRLKVCDFGTVADLKSQMTNNRGSAAWMAPEVFSSNKYDDKCDVFSFGVILWEMITRRKPYAELGGPAYRVMWKVYEGYRPPPVLNCPPIVEQLMKNCWLKDAHFRPSMQEVHQMMERLIQLFPGGDVPLKRVDLDTTPEVIMPQPQPLPQDLRNEHSPSPMSEASSALADGSGTPVTLQLRQPATPPRVNESTESLHSIPQSESPGSYSRGHRRGGSYETALLATDQSAAGDAASALRGGSTFVHRSNSSVLDRPKQLPIRLTPPPPPPKPRREAPPPPTTFEYENGLASGGESAEASPIDDLPSYVEIEAHLRPLPPDQSNEESMRIYREHSALVDEYREMQKQIRKLAAEKQEMINSVNRSIDHKALIHQKEKLLSTKSDLQLKMNARSRANPVIDHR